MNWQLIFNPFSVFTEKQLAASGIALTFIGTAIGYFCNSSFNGALDMHLMEDRKLITVFLENCINISIVTVVFFALGNYFNAKTRFIDLLNTAFWYRLPLYITGFLSYVLLPKNIEERITKNVKTPENIFTNFLEIVMIVFLGILVLLCLAYAIVLLVNGFKTATNTKKWQHWVAFGFVILIIEGITQFLIRQLL